MTIHCRILPDMGKKYTLCPFSVVFINMQKKF